MMFRDRFFAAARFGQARQVVVVEQIHVGQRPLAGALGLHAAGERG